MYKITNNCLYWAVRVIMLFLILAEYTLFSGWLIFQGMVSSFSGCYTHFQTNMLQSSPPVLIRYLSSDVNLTLVT